MTDNGQHHCSPGLLLFALLSGLAAGSPARGQDTTELGKWTWRPPILGTPLCPAPPPALSTGNNYSSSRVPRVRLFGMPSGFLQDPVGIDTADDSPSGTLDSQGPFGGFGGDNGPFLVVMGMDNPYFDYRDRYDAGGLGYYRIYSQVQLLDQGNSCLSLGLHAVTPAGLEAGGLADGVTVLSPTLAWFQELGDGAALHSFVSKNIRARGGWSEELDSGFQYGMALQYALPGIGSCPKYSIHLFVEALCRYRPDGDATQGRPMSWEFIPGIHWRMGENWRMSIGAARTNIITCSWRF